MTEVAVMAELLSVLGEMRAEADVAPSAAFTARARAAMHTAGQATPRRLGLLLLVGDAVRRHLTLVSASMATTAAAAAVIALGWSAPAGSPLHPVRLAHERVALVLPGVDRTGLELADAEGRLQDAQAGRNPAASLDEASSILDTARGDLPADHSAPDWQRWTRDEATLDSLRRSLAPAAGGAGGGQTGPSGGADGRPQVGAGGTAPTGDGGHPGDDGVAAPGATPDGDGDRGGTSETESTGSAGVGGSGDGGSATVSGGDGGGGVDGGRGGSVSTSTTSSSSGDHGGSTQSTSTTSTSASTTSSDGGGGPDRPAAATSSSTTTSSDGGGSGSGGGGSGGSTTQAH